MSIKKEEDMAFPEFPLSEYMRRYEQLVARGREQKIDAFIFTDEENLRYFAGGPLTGSFGFRSDYISAIIPTDREKPPRFVISNTHVNLIRSSWINDRCLWGGASIESSGDATVEAMVDSIRGLGLDRATVAMEISGNEKLFMAASVFDAVRRSLPGMGVVSCFPVVSAIRRVKSVLETECVRQACRISTEAIEHGIASIRTGSTEKDIVRTIKAKMYELGADEVPFLAVVAGWEGRSICWDSYPTEYAVRPGDPIQIDGGCSVKGYMSDMVRTASLGPIRNQRYLDLYDAAVRAHGAVRDLLQPGTVVDDLCRAGRQSIVDDGFEDLLVFGTGQTGHGLGIGIHEAPFLVPGSMERLAPGMVVSVEPAILEAPNVEVATFFTILENNYLITETGHEQLTNSPGGIRVVREDG